jgi:uncharacterized protein YggE
MSSRTISTHAVGRCEAPPDFATIEAVAKGEGDFADEAQAEAAECAARIEETVTDTTANQFETVEIQLQNGEEDLGSIGGAPFEATHELHVDCPPDRAKEVALDVVEVGGQISSIDYKLHEETSRRLEDEALAAAVERAREKAERMARIEGLAVAEVRSIANEAPGSEFNYSLDITLSTTLDGNIHPEPIGLSQQVEVEYKLTEQ